MPRDCSALLLCHERGALIGYRSPYAKKMHAAREDNKRVRLGCPRPPPCPDCACTYHRGGWPFFAFLVVRDTLQSSRAPSPNPHMKARLLRGRATFNALIISLYIQISAHSCSHNINRMQSLLYACTDWMIPAMNCQFFTEGRLPSAAVRFLG